MRPFTNCETRRFQDGPDRYEVERFGPLHFLIRHNDAQVYAGPLAGIPKSLEIAWPTAAEMAGVSP